MFHVNGIVQYMDYVSGFFYWAKYFQASHPCKGISALILFMTEYIPLYGHTMFYASISHVRGHSIISTFWLLSNHFQKHKLYGFRVRYFQNNMDKGKIYPIFLNKSHTLFLVNDLFH